MYLCLLCKSIYLINAWSSSYLTVFSNLASELRAHLIRWRVKIHFGGDFKECVSRSRSRPPILHSTPHPEPNLSADVVPSSSSPYPQPTTVLSQLSLHQYIQFVNVEVWINCASTLWRRSLVKMRLIIASLLLVGCLEIRSCYSWMVPMASSFLRQQDSSSISLFRKSSGSSQNRICIDRPLFFSSYSTNPASFRRHGGRLCLGASEKDEFVEAEDLEALQTLFSKYCDSEGLMTKLSVMQIPAISELMVRVVYSSCCSAHLLSLGLWRYKML